MAQKQTYRVNAFGDKILRGYIVREDNDKQIPFQFNPEEVSEDHSATYVSIDSPGSSYPEINFINIPSRSRVLTIHLDQTVDMERGDYVEDIIDEIIDLTKPSEKMVIMRRNAGMFTETPTCWLVIGAHVLRCKIPEVKVIRKGFDKNLRTIAAMIDIEFLEVSN